MQKLITLIAIFAVAINAAEVRVAHAVPDAPQVDVYVDGNLIWNFVPFRQVTAYVELPEGSDLTEIANYKQDLTKFKLPLLVKPLQ